MILFHINVNQFNDWQLPLFSFCIDNAYLKYPISTSQFVYLYSWSITNHITHQYNQSFSHFFAPLGRRKNSNPEALLVEGMGRHDEMFTGGIYEYRLFYFLRLIFIIFISSSAIWILLFPSLLHAVETDYFSLYLFLFINFYTFSLFIY